MITDSIPRRKTDKEEYWKSDATSAILLPPEDKIRNCVQKLDQALKQEDPRQVERICNSISLIVADVYEVSKPPISVLGVRPHRTSDGHCIYEKFGDYDVKTTEIRLWMRTSMIKKVSSLGVILNTLCHELCHHLDIAHFGFPNTYHTRGFYGRTALLYHHAKDTPVRPIVWVKQKNGTFQVDWAKTMKKTKA